MPEDPTLDGAAWSAPGWLGGGEFWSQDAADYYVKWLQSLRDVYGIQLDAVGYRNEKGVNFSFAKRFRGSLDDSGFEHVKLHAFDNWPEWKFDCHSGMAPKMGDSSTLISDVNVVNPRR